MSNYTKATNFATKDSLPTGNALKIVSGTEIDTEFSNIETAVNTKADTTAMTAADALKANTASPTFTGVPSAPTATAGTNTTQVATTAFVATEANLKANIAGFASTGIDDNATSTQLTVTDTGIEVAGGVYLGGTGSANLLDDYEEGTWVPSIGGNATYTAQSGSYTKIGDTVHVECDITINVKGTGDAGGVSGLPFTALTNTAMSVGYYSGLAVSVHSIAPWTGTTSILLFGTASSAGITATSLSILGNGSRIMLSGTYKV